MNYRWILYYWYVYNDFPSVTELNAFFEQRKRNMKISRILISERLLMKNAISEAQFRSDFRFSKSDFPKLFLALKFRKTFKNSSGHLATGEEVLLMVLRRLAYPGRLYDLCLLFGRSKGEISKFVTLGINHIFWTWRHLLVLSDRYLSLNKLRELSAVIANKGVPLTDCIGFIDGTLKSICRPSKNDNRMYNGHKKTYGVKFQGVVAPDGIIIHFSGPYRGARHDSAILSKSGLYKILEEKLNFGETKFCIYGDSAYAIQDHVHCPYKGTALKIKQKEFNETMSKVRISVEWTFGKISKEFAFVDYKKNLKLHLQPIGKLCLVAALLTNCHTCFYGSETSQYFNYNPPNIEDYLFK
jgi:hypothetical protein